MSRETVRERFAYGRYRAARWLARTLPERTGRRVFESLGSAAYRLLPGVRATVTANQAQVLGRPQDDPLVQGSARKAFLLYARYWQETFLAVAWSDDEVRSRFQLEGLGHVTTALEKGNGAILALPHMGNWDVAGRFMALEGYPVVSVAEELEPRRLFDMFQEHRRELGMEVIGLSDGAVGRQLAGKLAQNRVVALVADRDLGGRGVEVEMFGRPRRMPAGPALLSVSTGAPLIPSPVYTTERGWHCILNEPLELDPTGDRKRDVMALSRLLAKAFERAISAAPADWHLFQPGWEP